MDVSMNEGREGWNHLSKNFSQMKPSTSIPEEKQIGSHVQLEPVHATIVAHRARRVRYEILTKHNTTVTLSCYYVLRRRRTLRHPPIPQVPQGRQYWHEPREMGGISPPLVEAWRMKKRSDKNGLVRRRCATGRERGGSGNSSLRP